MDEYSSSTTTHEIRFFLLGFVGLIIFMILVSKAFPADAPLTPQQVQQMDHRSDMPNYMTKPDEAKSHIDDLVKKAKGEYTLLSEEERSWLDSMTASHGYEMFVGRAKTLLPKPKVKAKANANKKVPLQE